MAVLEKFCRPALYLLVCPHPDRTQAQHRYLPGIPVGETIESRDLREFVDAVCVPAGVGRAVACGCHESCEYLVLPDEVHKIVVPDLAAPVGLNLFQTLVFKKLDCLDHDLT